MIITLIPLAMIMVHMVLANVRPTWGWRTVFSRSIVLLAGYMVLGTETLSLIEKINVPNLAIMWIIPTLVCGTYLLFLKNKGQAIRANLPGLPTSRLDQVLLVAIMIVLITTAAIAWIAPPNTWDSLNTHMSRVAHWAQNGSLKPFATGIEKQNYYPPYPGISILQSYVLTESDRLANFPQWFAMVACIVVASKLAERLGASTSGQFFTGLFIATLPMGIAQASSTMTDYLVALWIIIVAFEAVVLVQNYREKIGFQFIGIAAGLAINTKPTAFAYLLPFAVYVAYTLIRRSSLRDTLMKVVLVICLVSVINAGYFSRNIQVYGSPIGTGGDVAIHRNEMLNWRVLLSNTLRNAALHAGTPFRILNQGIYFVLDRIHDGIGLGLTDPRTSVHPGFVIRPPTTDEAKSGNPLHAMLILITLAITFVKRRENDSLFVQYSSLVLLTFLLLSIAFKFSIFGSRYHLAFFVLFAPVVSTIFEKKLSRPTLELLGVLLMLASWSWLVGIQERPLLPRNNESVSILDKSRDELYFVLAPGYYKVYQDFVHRTQEQDCRNVAVVLQGTAAEYPFWVLFGAPRDDLTIEWIVGGTPSARFSDSTFQPCAAICDSSCPVEWQDVRGLPLAHERAGFLLYLKDR